MTWLNLIGLDQYIPNFLDGGFDDMEFVKDLTVDDLETIEIKKPGHRRKLWLAASALKETNDGNNSEFKTSYVRDDPLNGKVKPFLQTDLDALTGENEKPNFDITLQEIGPEKSDAISVSTANTETKLSKEEENGVKTSEVVEENEPDLDSMLADVGVEGNESGNEQERVDQVLPFGENNGQIPNNLDIHSRITVSESFSNVKPVESQTLGNMQVLVVNNSTHAQTIETEVQSPSKLTRPPVRPKPRSSSGSRENLDQISDTTELYKDKSPSVKSKPHVEARGDVKEMSSKFVANGDSKHPPPVRPKLFKNPPHVPPKPLNSDPVLRATSFSHYVKKQDGDGNASRERSGSESK